MVHDAGIPIVCCGEKMEALVANTVEASGEKHVPVATVEGDTVKVNVGSVDHPMIPEHLIEWIYLETENGGQRKVLKAGDKPNVSFCLGGDKAVAVYAYCNLHGLWKTEI
jgi:superoxide reductase